MFDYEPNPQDSEQEEENDQGEPDDQFDYEERLEEDEIDEEVEVVEDQFEDPDEEMHDRGTYALPHPQATCQFHSGVNN